jgi:hypothetical protein
MSDKRSARLAVFLAFDALWKFLDEFGGSTITEVPATLKDELRIANRMCRFLLEDGKTVIGTGFLVGPSHVMTAAHVFFEPDGKEKCKLIDPDRPGKVSVEFLTFLAGDSVVSSSPPRAVKLSKDWAVDPNSSFDREVGILDFAVVKLEVEDGTPVGEEPIGGGNKREWFEIPHPLQVPTLAVNSMIRTFQYHDRGTLRTSIGTVRGVSQDRTRVLYNASTLDAASGSVVVNDRLQLTGIHASGPDEENPFENQGLPLLRIAKYLEDKGARLSVSPKVVRA